MLLTRTALCLLLAYLCLAKAQSYYDEEAPIDEEDEYKDEDEDVKLFDKELLEIYRDLKFEIDKILDKQCNTLNKTQLYKEIDKQFKFINTSFTRIITTTTTTTKPTTTTTTTTPPPPRIIDDDGTISTCSEPFGKECVKSWQCKHQLKESNKYIININADNRCRYMEVCCDISNKVSDNQPNSEICIYIYV